MSRTIDNLQDVIIEIQFALQESYTVEGFLSALEPLRRGLSLCTTPLEQELFLFVLQETLKNNL